MRTENDDIKRMVDDVVTAAHYWAAYRPRKSLRTASTLAPASSTAAARISSDAATSGRSMASLRALFWKMPTTGMFLPGAIEGVPVRIGWIYIYWSAAVLINWLLSWWRRIGIDCWRITSCTRLSQRRCQCLSVWCYSNARESRGACSRLARIDRNYETEVWNDMTARRGAGGSRARLI